MNIRLRTLNRHHTSQSHTQSIQCLLCVWRKLTVSHTGITLYHIAIMTVIVSPTLHHLLPQSQAMLLPPRFNSGFQSILGSIPACYLCWQPQAECWPRRTELPLTHQPRQCTVHPQYTWAVFCTLLCFIVVYCWPILPISIWRPHCQ